MIKKLLLPALLLVSLLTPVSLVYADDVLSPVCPADSPATLCQDNTNQPVEGNSIYGPNGILTKAAKLISILAGVAAVILIIVGGIQYVISSGDSTNVQNAKNTILYAIIGLIVALLAQAIIAFVLTRL